jgi:CBS domain-containing protein
MTVQALVDERVLGAAERAFLVRRDGSVVGLLTTSDLSKLPRDRWDETAVAHVMVPAAQVHTITPQTGLLDAMRLMQEHDIHQLPVLDDGRLVGMVTRGDVLRQLEVRMQFQDGQT